jgi:hypothetical protein
MSTQTRIEQARQVVAVQQQSVCCRYSDGESRIRANRVDLVSRLKRAGITISLWPSG